MAANREIDAVTGVETTGHVWDGDLKELNKPLPRWWLLTFYATIVWALAFTVFYPAWPTFQGFGFTPGLLGYHQRAVVDKQVADGHSAQSAYRDQLAKTALGDIRANADLYRFTVAGGAAAFQTNCAPCHGRGAQGGVGFPNLNTDAWRWGGTLDQIHLTIQHGIRWAADKDTHDSAMPKFGVDKLLTDEQIDDVSDYVISLSRKDVDAAKVDRGQKIFAEQCAICHGENAKGNLEIGAPNLTSGLWLYGGRKEDIVTSIRTGRGGVMPAWAGRLDPVTIKSLALYVHDLGGGK